MNVYSSMVLFFFFSISAEAEKLIAPEATPDKETTSSSSETTSSSKPSEAAPATQTLPSKQLVTDKVSQEISLCQAHCLPAAFQSWER